MAPAATPPAVFAPGAAFEALEPWAPELPPLVVPYVVLFCLAVAPSGGLDGEAFPDAPFIPAPLGDDDF